MNNPLDISGASSEALRHCATVVNFTTSRWYDSRKDDRISDAGAHTTGADPAAVTSHKKLLGTRRSEYLAVSREVSRAEKIHEKLGQPYRHGRRILPNAMLMDYIAAMEEQRAKLVEDKDRFRAALPAILAQAQRDLGPLYDPTQYPDEDQIVERFDFSYDFEPLPVGEHLVNMPDGFEESLQEQVETKVHEHMQAAVTGAWKKVWDALDGIVARAMTPEIIFKRSLLDKLENCLDTVRGFNVLDDSDYEKLITDIENDIMRRDAKDYRADPDLMRGLAHYAQKHRDKIGGLTGRSDDSVSLPCETVPVPAPAQSDEPANVPETPSEAIQALVEDAEADGMPTTLPDPFVPPAEPLEQLQPESTEESEDSLDDLLSSLLG